MTSSNIKDSLDRVSSIRVCVIGDLMLDTYTYGKVERISPEAPVPIIKIEKEVTVLGGAGNVYANLLTIGTIVNLIGSVGEDDDGKKIIALLSKNVSIEEDRVKIYVDKKKPTINKNRIVAGTQQLLRIDNENEKPIDLVLESKVIGNLSKILNNIDVVCVADYGKGFITHNIVKAIKKNTDVNNIPVIIDTKPKNISFFKDFTLITPNEKELFEMTEEGTVSERAYALSLQTGTNVLVTRGSNGVLYCDAKNKNKNFTLPSFAEDVRDVSGAGDTIAAFTVVGIALGMDIYDAVSVANKAAAIAVSKPHTNTVTLDELIQKL